ncbi:MAG: agmatine/peptidylarginine deiminase [Rubrivivax sp.]
MDEDTARAAGLTRRRLLQAGSRGAAWVGAAWLARSGHARAAGADGAAWRIPADFEPARAIWIGWDTAHREISVQLARELAPHATVEVAARTEEGHQEALAALSAAGLSAPRVQVHLMPEALFFVRDGAVFATAGGGALGVVDFAWNDYGRPGWCRTLHPGNPGAWPGCEGGSGASRQDFDLALAQHLGAQVLRVPLVAEGGSIESNGQGLVIANAALVQQRHPGRAFGELQRLYGQLPGVRKVIWLPAGLAQDPPLRATITGRHVAWGTGGHTDEFVRFADARTVLLAWPDEAEAARHPVARLNLARMRRNLEILSRATDLEGRPLRVLRLPLPRTVERRVFLSAAADPGWSEQWSAAWFPASERRRQGDAVMQVAITSTLNFVVANGLVLVPGYTEHGTPRATQDRVQRVLEQAFAGRRVRFIDAIGLNWVGAGPHCATLNEPRLG